MTRARHFVLAAGGTGGHMVPAAALAEELMRRGHRVALVSDARGVRFPGLFEGVQTHVLPAGRLAGGPLGRYKVSGNLDVSDPMALVNALPALLPVKTVLLSSGKIRIEPR